MMQVRDAVVRLSPILEPGHDPILPVSVLGHQNHSAILGNSLTDKLGQAGPCILVGSISSQQDVATNVSHDADTWAVESVHEDTTFLHVLEDSPEESPLMRKITQDRQSTAVYICFELNHEELPVVGGEVRSATQAGASAW